MDHITLEFIWKMMIIGHLLILWLAIWRRDKKIARLEHDVRALSGRPKVDHLFHELKEGR